jgi:hypothetical protein
VHHVVETNVETGSGDPRNRYPPQALYASSGLTCCCAACQALKPDSEMGNDARLVIELVRENDLIDIARLSRRN